MPQYLTQRMPRLAWKHTGFWRMDVRRVRRGSSGPWLGSYIWESQGCEGPAGQSPDWGELCFFFLYGFRNVDRCFSYQQRLGMSSIGWRKTEASRCVPALELCFPSPHSNFESFRISATTSVICTHFIPIESQFCLCMLRLSPEILFYWNLYIREDIWFATTFSNAIASVPWRACSLSCT